MQIGKRLLFLRKKNLYSLDQAALGIVSSTHLSNIENGRFQPSEDILLLLAKKYQVPEDYLLSYDKKDLSIEQPLKEILFYIITDELEEAEARIKIIENKEYIPHLEQEMEYMILKTCYLMKRKLPYQEELEKLQFFINEEELNYPSYIHQCYSYLMVQISFENKEYDKCYQYIHVFLRYDLPPKVYATIQFQLLIILYYVKKRIQAVKHAESALKLFYQNHHWKYVAESYNILMAIYWTEEDYETALNYGKKALELAEMFDYDDTKQRVYHNLGSTYKAMQKYDEAAKYYAKAIELKKKLNISTRNSFWSILDMYATLKDKKSFDYWYKQLDLDEEDFFYLQLKMKPELIPHHLTELEKFAKNAEKREFWDLAIEMYSFLGKHYYENRKYKTAIQYYQKIIELQEKEKKYTKK